MWPDAPAAPDYALVWKPPAELFARVRPAKAIFNLGAGVDVLLAVPDVAGWRARDPSRGRRNGGADGRVRHARGAARLPRSGRLCGAAARRPLAAAAPARQIRIRRRHPRLRRAGASRRGGARALRFSACARGATRGSARRASSRSPGAPNCAPFLAAVRGCSFACCRRRPQTRGLLDRRRVRGAAARRPRRQRRARRHRGRRRPDRGARPRPSRRAPRSTSFAPSRCPPVIRSGIIRGSR